MRKRWRHFQSLALSQASVLVKNAVMPRLQTDDLIIDFYRSFRKDQE